ncbi:oxidoreductase [Streptomyces sp. NPDC057002]|uniref:oxidoreductase n=1 Tax=Streptomyces sp. NPDC057002 TaxID=3345992 RepID=UPI00363E480A
MATEKWTPAPLPDLSGRTVVVTGASSGLGAVTARELARAGARIVLAVRNLAKGRSVAEGIKGDTEVRALDLGDLASVRAFADSWSEPLDILINNAGIMGVPQGRTADGFELQFGTNHLGHFALTNLLLPHISDRIVTLSSGLSFMGRIQLDDLNWQNRPYKPMRAYAQSKLANLLFTVELQRRLTERSSSVRALNAHPGVATTPLEQHLRGLTGAFTRFSYLFYAQRKAEYGALPVLYAATQDVAGGSYVGPSAATVSVLASRSAPHATPTPPWRVACGTGPRN